MQSKFFDSKTSSYALISNQILNILYKFDSSKKNLNPALIEEAKVLLQTIQDGAILQETKDLSSLNYITNKNGFFIYNYGLKALKQFGKDEDAKLYLKSLLSSLDNINIAQHKEISNLESFFEVISDLLNHDLESARYMVHDRNNFSINLLSVSQR